MTKRLIRLSRLPVRCPECDTPLTRRRHRGVGARWYCGACGSSFTLALVERIERPGVATWRDVQWRLMVAVAHEPMNVADVARRLGVHRRTILRHTERAGSGLHVYDGRVYTGTARAWGHYV